MVTLIAAIVTRSSQEGGEDKDDDRCAEENDQDAVSLGDLAGHLSQDRGHALAPERFESFGRKPDAGKQAQEVHRGAEEARVERGEGGK